MRPRTRTGLAVQAENYWTNISCLIEKRFSRAFIKKNMKCVLPRLCYFASLCLTFPSSRLALPCFALPSLAYPCLALPCLTLSCLALPCLALPSHPLGLPYLALPWNDHLWLLQWSLKMIIINDYLICTFFMLHLIWSSLCYICIIHVQCYVNT